MITKMKSHKPHMVNAYRNWLEDNNLTAIGVFDVKGSVAKVPEHFICPESGFAIIELSSDTAMNLTFDGEFLSFEKFLDGDIISFNIPLDLTVMLKPKEVKDDSIHLPFEISNSILEKYKEKDKFNGLRLV
jgi:stringent starvation protein B